MQRSPQSPWASPPPPKRHTENPGQDADIKEHEFEFRGCVCGGNLNAELPALVGGAAGARRIIAMGARPRITPASATWLRDHTHLCHGRLAVCVPVCT